MGNSNDQCSTSGVERSFIGLVYVFSETFWKHQVSGQLVSYLGVKAHEYEEKVVDEV